MTADAAAGRVVLDLGPGVGALVLYAPADLEGAEIEISPDGGQGQALTAPRTHALVRRRDAGGTACYAAVYQALTAGPYVVWRDCDTPACTVLVTGGEVTTWRLPGIEPSMISETFR